MPFTYDVFVSYARNDDQDRDRIQEFVEDLTQKLGTRIGRRARVAFDKDFQPSEEFKGGIRKKVEASALMLALISPSYNQSAFSQGEVQWFCDQASSDRFGLKVGPLAEDRRIVNVTLLNVSYEKWFLQLQGSNPHVFWFQEGRLVRELRRIHGDPYVEAVERLADNLASMLESMGETPTVPATPPVQPPDDSQMMVFVAKPAPNEVIRYQRVVNGLKGALSGLGVKVVGWEDYSGPTDGRNAWTATSIAHAAVSVHLVGSIDDASTREQLRRGLHSAARTIVWRAVIPDGNGMANPYGDEVDRFRASLQRDSPKQIEDMRTPASEAMGSINERVLGWLKTMLTPPGLRVCVNLAARDRNDDDADRFFEYLKECGIEPLASTADTDFDSEIPRAKGVVVFYGDVPQDWVAESFHRAVRAATSVTEGELETWSIYYAKPESHDKQRWRCKLRIPLDLIEIDGRYGFQEELVYPLLAKLGVTPPVRKSGGSATAMAS